MSKEREVLLEALEWMEELKYVWANSRNAGDYDLLDLIAGINKIERILAQPETEQEPVAWMYDWKTPSEEIQNVFRSKNHLTTDLRCVSNEVENVRPLYLAPPTREPLSDESIAEQAVWAANTKHSFKEGVRWAEAQHNITGVGDE